MEIGDRVLTPTGRKGTILEPNADMPNHHLIQFDSDRALWILRSILKPPIETRED